MRGLTRRATGTTAVVIAAGLLLATPALAASDWDLDYTAAGDGTISPFGQPDTATYGQTITVPDGPETLESFSFAVDLPATVVFRGVVQAWDPAEGHATGPVLYQSDATSTAGTGVETVTFTPDVAVTPGPYVLYLTVTYDYATAVGTGNFPWHNSDVYPDGAFVWHNNADDLAALTSEQWDNAGDRPADAVFSVVYAAPVVPPVTPPPATPVIVAPAYTG